MIARRWYDCVVCFEITLGASIGAVVMFLRRHQTGFRMTPSNLQGGWMRIQGTGGKSTAIDQEDNYLTRKPISLLHPNYDYLPACLPFLFFCPCIPGSRKPVPKSIPWAVSAPSKTPKFRRRVKKRIQGENRIKIQK